MPALRQVNTCSNCVQRHSLGSATSSVSQAFLKMSADSPKILRIVQPGATGEEQEVTKSRPRNFRLGRAAFTRDQTWMLQEEHVRKLASTDLLVNQPGILLGPRALHCITSTSSLYRHSVGQPDRHKGALSCQVLHAATRCIPFSYIHHEYNALLFPDTARVMGLCDGINKMMPF